MGSVVVHPRHPVTGVCSKPLDKQHRHKDGEDEEGEGAPLVQGGEGQGAKEVLRAHREAARQAKEGTRGGKSKVCPHRSPKRKEAWPEEQHLSSQSVPSILKISAALHNQ